jgi:hypothetical protein
MKSIAIKNFAIEVHISYLAENGQDQQPLKADNACGSAPIHIDECSQMVVSRWLFI